jgi:tetratricopeptide (TPR) repeat protein
MKSLAWLIILTSIAGGHGLAQEHRHSAGSHDGEQLGIVSFATSCSPAVQKPFGRGVALLHSFWYEESEKQFVEIAKADPSCAMAHWGVAMSLYHQLWDRATGGRLKRGMTAAETAVALKAGTPRERGYVDAIAAFYADAETRDHAARADAYTAAMARLYAAFPDDLEAGAFYGLALLASAPPNDVTFANAKKAVEVLMPLMRQQPAHPGLAHYIIHACDNPTMAPQGLEAARRYAAIAPSSPHAVHMPSHIFSRLGLWQESIQSNLASVDATKSADEQKRGGSDHALHAMDFLNYAYLQVGRDKEAKAVVADALRLIDALGKSHIADHEMAGYLDYARAQFPALYAMEVRDWTSAAALEAPAGSKPLAQTITYWARGTGAARAGNAIDASRSAGRFEQLLEDIGKSSDAYILAELDVVRDQLRAWVAFAEGRGDEAVRVMRDAADRQDARGKGEVEIPAREMLADILLELARPGEALAEYERSMTIDPNRFNALFGAGVAAEKVGKPELARKYYATLLKNCEGSGSARVELARAKRSIDERKASQRAQ